MTPYDARLSALHEKLLRKRQLCAERNELNAQLSQLQKTERLLRSIRTAEQEDVDKLQRVSLSSLFYSIVSQKEEKLAKEQAEAYAAAVKHDAAIQQCRTVEQRLLSVETELQTLSTTEREYEETLAQKAEALKTADPARGAALCRMEDRLGLGGPGQRTYRSRACRPGGSCKSSMPSPARWTVPKAGEHGISSAAD